jgi:hypothetical protein
MKFKTTWESKSILGLALLAFFAKQTVSINSAWAFILTFGGCNLSCYIHAVRNCGGLSLCDLCYASLLTMSISARIVVAVTFHEVDHAPDTEACTECDNECLKYAYCAVEKCHILLRNQRDLLSWAAAPVSGVPGFFPPFFSLSAAADVGYLPRSL